VIDRWASRVRYVKRRYRLRFPKSLPDDDVPLSLDMSTDSRTLLVAFGGMRGRIGMPPFEFLNLTGAIPVKRLFVRDLRQAWYHRGMPGHGDSLLDVAQALKEVLTSHDVQRLVVAGNSSGGYAALVFGTLLGADTVLCFAPQTILDLDVLASMDDHRWDEQLQELTAAGELDPRWVDLRQALPGARQANTRYQVYFDETLEVDRLHAERLKQVANLRLYRFGRGGHYLIRRLRDAGALERVLRSALDAPSDERRQALS
jgi:pimeloyl-ACP methyl ester carboxylesterase